MDNRQDVRQKEPVLSLHGVDVIEIVVDVPESGRALFATSDVYRDFALVASFDFAPGREFPIVLKEFASAADPRTRTYKATFSMPQPEGLDVRPGMTASVRAFREAGSAMPAGEIVVPAHAVFSGDDGTQYVWVVGEDLTVTQREVSIGVVTGTASIIVTAGLEPGQRIATTGVTQLREGMQIRLME